MKHNKKSKRLDDSYSGAKLHKSCYVSEILTRHTKYTVLDLVNVCSNHAPSNHMDKNLKTI